MARQLVLRGPRDLGIADSPTRSIGPGDVRLRSVISGISHGTELLLYSGEAPFGSVAFDITSRAFAPRSEEESYYPRALGYEMVSRVTEVGSGVAELKPGDLVHTGTPHQDEAIIDYADAVASGYPLVRLPESDPPERGVFISLAMVALQAVHDAALKVGDTVVVSGLGVIGLLTVQLARLNGALSVIAIDPVGSRRQLATHFGATTVIDPGDEGSLALAVRAANEGRGVDVAIETSGSYEALHGAISCAHLGGRVVSVGFYKGGATNLRLGEEWHHNRLTMISSMGLWGCPHRDYPLWDRRRLLDVVVDLLFTDRLVTEGLISARVPFEKAPEVYAGLFAQPDQELKVVFVY